MIYKNKKYKKSNQAFKIVTLVISLLIIALIILVLEKRGVINIYENSQSSEVVSENPEQSINLDPPTENEAASGNQHKEKIIENSSGQPKPDTAMVVIVDASQYEDSVEVRAFASNVIANGTCTITFTQATTKIVKTVNAFADASTSPCVNLNVPISEFTSSGNWEVNVEYESSEITGSANTNLTIE